MAFAPPIASPSTPPPPSSSEGSSRPVKTVKDANKPYLVHKKWKADRYQSTTAPSLTSKEPGSGSILFSALGWIVLGLLLSGLISQMVTETWLWGYEGKYSNRKNLMNRIFPPKPRLFGEKELSLHDGSRATHPVYLGLDGDVYDVSAGAGTYGPGGSYHIFAGKDAARAFVTGCFKTHLTHDLRGLESESDLKALAHWKQFFANSAKYSYVGKIVHPPIDPSSPLPAPCDARAEGGAM